MNHRQCYSKYNGGYGDGGDDGVHLLLQTEVDLLWQDYLLLPAGDLIMGVIDVTCSLYTVCVLIVYSVDSFAGKLAAVDSSFRFHYLAGLFRHDQTMHCSPM